MMDQSQLETIRDHPIGDGLDAFHASFEKACKDRGISCPTPDALGQLDQQDLRTLAYNLLSRILSLYATPLLRSIIYRRNLFDDLLRFIPALIDDWDNFDLDQIKPLFHAVLTNKPDDEIWD
ncbi:hypothetical protein N0V85_003877 [Neurospora sp. IMI 360204]|nr:hypothetical protein N0V85_003877 [Neurospora sp. IMI 360204]